MKSLAPKETEKIFWVKFTREQLQPSRSLQVKDYGDRYNPKYEFLKLLPSEEHFVKSLVD